MIDSCVMCVIIERAWATASCIAPHDVVIDFILDGELVRAQGLDACPSCGDERGPPSWCGDAYQDEDHAREVTEAEHAWREELAA